MRSYFFLSGLITFIFIFVACKEDTGREEQIGIRLQNNTELTIDTLQFVFLTETNSTAVEFLHLEPLTTSEFHYFDQVKYFYRESNDIFLISEGFFSIGEEHYDLSNCFCDPELNEGSLFPGDYTIRVNGIDPLRKNVNYLIERE